MTLTVRSLAAFPDHLAVSPDDELWIEFQREGELIREKVLTFDWDAVTQTVTFRGESTRRRIVYADEGKP